jgi:hypothetical protein
VSFLPIVARELRAASRHSATYRTRTGLVLATSLLSAGLLLLAPSSASAAGNILFPLLCTLALVFCTLAGARQTADCLSEEKREGTLGLLFLTDLRGYDIVLGKLIAVSARSFQGLFAFFPVLAIGLTLGGITIGEFWRSSASLTNALFFTLGVGIWVSARSVQSVRALATTAIVLLWLNLAPLAADWLITWVWPRAAGWARMLSPAGITMLASDVVYRQQPAHFWGGLLLTHFFGWLLLGTASAALPHRWRDQGGHGPPELRPIPLQPGAPSRDTAEPAVLHRRRLHDRNPMDWLASRSAVRPGWVRAFVALIMISGAALWLLSSWFGGRTFGLIALLQISIWLALKLWVAWQATATLAEARRTGAIEILIVTPLTIEEMIRGHWQALQRLFLWPVLAALLLQLLPVVSALTQQAASGSAISLWFPIPATTLFSAATYVLDLVAIAWVGMWMGLSEGKSMQAFWKTVLYTMVVPALFFCFPNLLFDLFWISWSRRKLEHEWRRLAAGDSSRR